MLKDNLIIIRNIQRLHYPKCCAKMLSKQGRNVTENAAPARLGPTIRILGMINRLEPKVKTFCQIWFQGSGQPVISRVLEYKYIWFKKWGNYKHGIFQPYMLACQG